MSTAARAEARATRAAAGERLRWSPAKVLAAVVLAAWAGTFWFLIVSDRTSFYLSARTAWVVPVGAVILSIAALGQLASARVSDPQPLRIKSTLGIGILLIPVVVVLALPPAALGSYAAGRRSSFIGAGFISSPEDLATGELSLIDVAGAVRSREAMQALTQRAGTEVSFTGFVSVDDGAPADEFMLTRFLISCCVADALSVQVRVVGAQPGQFQEDDWVRVEGSLYPLGREVIVQASEVTGVPRPKRPYLNP